MTVTIDEDRLSETFAALANPTRRAILARLAEGAATVNELADPFELALPAVSKHIKVLERAGLVIRGQRAQYRPCALDAAPLQDVSTWVEQYRCVWETRFDRIEEFLAQLREQQGAKEHDDDRKGERTHD
jgi:DNA-binding transcriptional ArsR family regulator